MHTMHHFVLPKLRLVFFATNTPNPFLEAQNNVSGWFRAILLSEGVQVVRSGFGVHKMHYFVLPKLRLVFFRNELAQSTSLGPKLSFWVVSRDSVAWRYPL